MPRLVQPKQLSPDQLLRKAKELDAREAYITAREKIEVELEESIVALQLKQTGLKNQIKVLEDSVVAHNEQITADQERHGDLERLYTQKVEEFKTELANYKVNMSLATEAVANAKTELAAVKQSIAERQQYQSEQESLISEHIKSGNGQLTAIDYEITEAKHLVKELKTETRTLHQDKKLLETDIERARADFNTEYTEYEQHIATLRGQGDKLVSANADLEAQHAKLEAKTKAVHEDADAKLKLLDRREREVMAKRDALAAEDHDMQEKRHRWASRQSLYDVQ